MINPYESPRTTDHESPHQKPFPRVQFAGWWLVVAGLVHVLLSNYLTGVRSWDAVDWSFLFFSVLGLLVLCRLTIVLAITRFIGSFFLVGLFFLIPAVFFSGQRVKDTTIEYGPLTVVNPDYWQFGLALFLFAATIVPPWWALQRELAEQSPSVFRERVPR